MPKRPVRRPVAPEPAADATPREPGERLAKLLAAAGFASRRECESFVTEGRVMVDGVVVTDLARRVDPYAVDIAFDGEPLPRRKRVYFVVNKPDGVVCTARDPSGRRRVTDLIPPDLGRVFNVGRLDMASEGLILLTNDGELANRLMHPRHGVQKVYHVRVVGIPTNETLDQLRRGVYLAEGQVQFVDAKVKSTKKTGAILEVILDEGRNREIRRALARVGHKVQRLTRVAIGPVRLGEMPSGAYRPLTADEVKALHKAAHQGRPTEPAADEAPAHRPQRPASGTFSSARPSGRKPGGDKQEGGKPGRPPRNATSGSTPRKFPPRPAGRFSNQPPTDKPAAAAPTTPARTIFGDVDPAAPAAPTQRERPARTRSTGKPFRGAKGATTGRPPRARKAVDGDAAPAPAPAEEGAPPKRPSRRPASPAGRPPRKAGGFVKKPGKPAAGAKSFGPAKGGKPGGGKPKPKGRPKKRGGA
ncbi:MAG: pseudouridine synthase [Lacipirellulaceae bacterium]